jgi:hypothetical protein
MPRLPVNGIEVYCRDEGRGSGEPDRRGAHRRDLVIVECAKTSAAAKKARHDR